METIELFDIVDRQAKRVQIADGRISTVEVISKEGLPSFHAAFVDNHCHILPTGLDLAKLHLGSADSHQQVFDLLTERHRVQPEGWLLAVHYDQNRYQGVHLTRHDLDRISSTRPILLRHVNGHAGVANSVALQIAGVSADTPDPSGGQYRRDETGAPDGVLLERTLEIVSEAAPAPSLDKMVSAIRLASDEMRRVGIYAAADMMTGRFNLERELEAYRLAALESNFHYSLYLQWGTVFGRRAMDPARLEEFKQALRLTGNAQIAGIKIFADGAIASATAAIYGAYENAAPAECSGQLIYSPERLMEMITTAAAADYAVAVHAIGDYAVDLVLDGFEATSQPSRHRLEHAMLLSDDQIDRIARVGCHVTMQPEFLHRFGHAYHRQLGAEPASNLKRFRSLLDAGVPLSFSSDRPIVAGDPRDGIRTAVNRPGFSPTERVTLPEALRMYTADASDVLGIGERFGRIAPGHPAPLPLTI
jgi:predicted amidohydrolase YtcJ